MAEVIRMQHHPLPDEEGMSLSGYLETHPEVMERYEKEWEEELEEMARLGDEDPRYGDDAKLRDMVRRQEMIGDKPYEELSEFEKRLVDRDAEELDGIIARTAEMAARFLK